ncbi:4-hydroxy-tetrahydrodipicolinate synthase [Lutibacter flavus]|uniref:4-hydroxy-tetrahydrodipicolinate synthase n=1 Tax=Lutibacter flavus TaxID=691689 RepID=A0A238V847_9FLAO|nr:4-hydroxy-tetrahydrodipicolinate synthase [Lutibacter flavus]SNR30590.1 4-hydroxy-tetrahydrodipicolinate synthase [Lutibacter flavus]
MKELLGTGVALVTPFNEDKSVDFVGLERLVNFQIENGVNYLVVLGTTGEPATLTAAEKDQVKATIIRVNNGRLPLVIGIGGNNTMAVIDEIKNSDLSAFAAILSVSPYYNKPTQEGIYQHFKAIAGVSPKPIILYNVPGRTGKNIEPNTVLRLANEFKNIVAVKEAAGDLVQAMRLIEGKPSNFMVISGDDMIALPMVLAGGSGVISVIGQGLPKDFSRMIQHGLKGDVKNANFLHYKIMDSIDYIFEECNPSGIKVLLAKVGICSSEVRLPLVKASEILKGKINNFIDNY